jgi:hypothetical protein
MVRKTVSLLLVLAGTALVVGCAGGESKDKTSSGPAEDDTVREVSLLIQAPARALVKVSTAGVVRGPRPVKIRRCEQTAAGHLRLILRLWDQEERDLQARLPDGWDPPVAGAQVIVVVDKAPRLVEGDKLNGVLLENRLWQVVATETVSVTKQNRDE